jgi:hypothetical protein
VATERISIVFAMNLERELNEVLPRYQVRRGQRGDGRSVFVITFTDYPQCRAEGCSVTEAMRQARLYFGAICDCRVAWKIDELLFKVASDAAERRPDH